ncbi:MAG: glycosyltransferase family 39 protein [Thalassolituus oleivorans]|uniref:ArnT family glycosyltransferase n=1 Tax=Thalassolituus oleivorans TaxID=187493 RepID=UPI001B43CA54|nr:glycosyltransferase family 39 protein [Thalassolituus oleivorans]MBQ0727720.1 glycosyltransferase family 39 protein [Thalassolituus oleivorans]MBQ0781357.1 glycosyltransferase family 39 protein [Thalassolituus oleivorans]
MRKLPMPLWLFATVAAVFFLNLNGYLLFDHDEGAFSEATRGMFERNDFITTYLNDRVRFDKPILIYWLQAASISIFGTEVWAFRLPSALAGLSWALCIFFFVRRYVDTHSAKAAVLIAATAIGINGIAHVATADALLNVLLAATLLSMYRFSQAPNNTQLYLIYALMALGVLTKGPVAVAIPLMVAALFFLTSGLKREFWRAIFFVPGWIVFIVIAAPWYVLEYQAQGQDFIDGFFLKHNVNRFNNAMEGHDGGFFFYPLVLPFVLAPFGALLLRIVPTVRHIAGSRFDLLDRFLWIWFLVVLVLFSLASTKLPHYILYGATPLVILMARHRSLLQSRLFSLVFPAILFAVFIAFPLLIPTIKAGLTNPIEIAVAERAGDYFDQNFAILAAVAALISLALILWRRFSPWFSLVMVGIVQALFIWCVFVPTFSETQQRPVYEAAQFVKQLGVPVVTQSIDMPSFNVYLDKVTERRSLKIGEIGFAREDRLSSIDHYQILFQSGPIVIIQRTAPARGIGNEPASTLKEDGNDQP